jgi:predicted lipoprotein with Yx(FWY)xxD motif
MNTVFKDGRRVRSLSRLACILSLSVMACTKNNSKAPAPPPNTPKYGVQLADNSKFGKVLTDSAGNTLYFFSVDADGSSGCTGNCIVTWPVFYTKIATFGDGLDPHDFATISRGDGKQQTTYKGWPLYYYNSDAKAGDINGDQVGKVWFVAKPDYTVMLAAKQLVGMDGKNYDSTYAQTTGITHYITDDHGRTLYAHNIDHFNTNMYTNPDGSNNAAWPCETWSDIKSVPSLLDKSKFDKLIVGGRSQLVYNGWPLYYFGADNQQRGSTKGISIGYPGLWPVKDGYSPAAPQ